MKLRRVVAVRHRDRVTQHDCLGFVQINQSPTEHDPPFVCVQFSQSESAVQADLIASRRHVTPSLGVVPMSAAKVDVHAEQSTPYRCPFCPQVHTSTAPAPHPTTPSTMRSGDTQATGHTSNDTSPRATAARHPEAARRTGFGMAGIEQHEQSMGKWVRTLSGAVTCRP